MMGHINAILLTVDAIICAVIVIRLTTYCRIKGRHSPLAAWFAYLVIVACGSVIIRILTGSYSHGNWSETLINLAMCILVLRSRGNIARIVSP
jgi:low temperature requirement protein LtrA